MTVAKYETPRGASIQVGMYINHQSTQPTYLATYLPIYSLTHPPIYSIYLFTNQQGTGIPPDIEASLPSTLLGGGVGEQDISMIKPQDFALHDDICTAN